MNLAQFISTGRPVSDELWKVLVEERATCGAERSQFTEYGEGYVIHRSEGLFYVHAWWYSPVGYRSFAQAMDNLYDWFLEWQE